MKRGTYVISGARVCLRFPAKPDLAEFVALNRASRRFHRGLVSPSVRPEHFESFLKRSHRADTISLFVCRRDDGAIVGSMTLSQIFRGGFKSAYLGYHVGAAYANQGYMTEAMQLLLRYGFGDLKLHRIEANIQPGNSASLALVKRAGFSREGFSRRYLKIAGQWRDHERWAILAEDWKQSRRAAATSRRVRSHPAD